VSFGRSRSLSFTRILVAEPAPVLAESTPKARTLNRKGRRFPRDSLEKTGRRLTSDPIRTSLGLLPSGPDPVGEWLVHRQSPGTYLGPKGQESKRGKAVMPRESGVSSQRRIVDKSMGLSVLDHPLS
jgi:hypothetical protein